MKEIRRNTEITSGNFSKYRDRLAKQGLLDTEKYGSASFLLPYFGEFVIKMAELFGVE